MLEALFKLFGIFLGNRPEKAAPAALPQETVQSDTSATTGTEMATGTDHGGTDTAHSDNDGAGDTVNGDMDHEPNPDMNHETDHGTDHDMDHDMGHDTGAPMDHGAHGEAIVPLPGVGATLQDIATFLEALFALEDTHSHDEGSALAHEHMAAMDLVPRDASTHVAIDSGDWSDPAIWSTGTVPGDGARVLIPEGAHVSYGTVSDADLFTVRVDGMLDFATDTDSQMIFDTMVVGMEGHLQIGSKENPVDPDVAVDLIVANNGPIDVEWDPMLLSRGIISHGEATIHGEAKDSHAKVTEDPMAGDTSLTFDGLPEGWSVGDTIVIAGTRYDGYKWDNDIREVRLYEPEDEVRVITAIDGDTVHFADALIHDHDAPRADLHTSVANYTRNVTIGTEDPELAEVHERGHVMFMHSDDVDVRYAAFHELGRTDKSTDSAPVDDFETIAADSNVQGRYSLHLHRAGVEDLDNPAIVAGNAVWGSPGWGYVHHDSNAVLENNASYDTVGAGYVAETGNETGSWADNIAIHAVSTNWSAPKGSSEIGADVFDIARGGDGFWFQGRMVSSFENVAASVNTGFAYFHRDGDDRMLDVPYNTFALPDALHSGSVAADDTPILFFDGNETFAAREGLHIVKANPNQGHDVWSRLTDFTAWSVKNGAHLEYTSHYILDGFDVIGKDTTDFSRAEVGLGLGNNTTDIVWMNAKVGNFALGYDLEKNFVVEQWEGSPHDYSVVNPMMFGNAQDFQAYDPAQDTLLGISPTIMSAPELTLDGPLTYKEGYPDPEARLVEISGTKTDSLGDAPFPSGTDDFNLDIADVVHYLETKGYWTTSDGENYFLLDIYMTDRFTGEIFYETHQVTLDDNVPVGNPHHIYRDAVENGVQDITVDADGQQWAGDVPLDVAIPVVIPTPILPSEDTAFGTFGDTDEGMMAGDEIMDLLTENQGTHDEAMPHGMAEEDEESPEHAAMMAGG